MDGSRKRASEIEGGGAPRWMVIYGDMMTLLLVFFVLFLAYSKVSNVKFVEAMGSLQKSLGILPARGGILPAERGIVPLEASGEGLEGLMEEMSRFVEEKGLEKFIRMQYNERRLMITLENPVLFDLGLADLKPTALPILDKVADLIREASHEISVEGHTCNLPIQTERFPSNWELSTARATSVIAHFIMKCDIPQERLSASGYAEYRPVAPNDSEANRALNRRIDIILVSQSNP